MVTCPLCQSDDLDLIEKLPDHRRHIRCNHCHHQWWLGEARPKPAVSIGQAAPLAKDPGHALRKTPPTNRSTTAPRPAAGVVNHTGKYRALWRWLRDQHVQRFTATFTEIEDVLGMPLPPSSRAHVQHWHSHEGSAVARAIADAGWHCADVNLTAERVTFIKS